MDFLKLNSTTTDIRFVSNTTVDAAPQHWRYLTAGEAQAFKSASARVRCLACEFNVRKFREKLDRAPVFRRYTDYGGVLA